MDPLAGLVERVLVLAVDPQQAQQGFLARGDGNVGRLAKGELTYQGRPVNPAAIRRTALLTVEGERDDICSIGQTLAAHDLCSKLAPYRKQHHLQATVGHYGVFNGKRWQRQIYPRLRDFIHAFDE